ncbi:MAG: alpha/beta fold hydrolase, partial [Shimia sp.]
GLIAMTLAATAKARLTGVCLNDIGPELMPEGLATISDYLGRRPTWPTLDAAIAERASVLPGFEGVPQTRWAQEVMLHYRAAPDGLDITYDPALREAVLNGGAQPAPDLWPLFDALEGLPLALIRGANSTLLSKATADEMARRRPDMIRAEVPGRGHVPFLDEAESRAALHNWTARL